MPTSSRPRHRSSTCLLSSAATSCFSDGLSVKNASFCLFSHLLGCSRRVVSKLFTTTVSQSSNCTHRHKDMLLLSKIMEEHGVHESDYPRKHQFSETCSLHASVSNIPGTKTTLNSDDDARIQDGRAGTGSSGTSHGASVGPFVLLFFGG